MAVSVSCIQPSTTAPELRHFHQRRSGHIFGGNIRLNRFEFGLAGRVVILHFFDAAEDFGKVDSDDRDASGFQNLFAVANGIECLRARADGPDPQVAQAPRHAADAKKPWQIFGELRGIGRFGVQRRQRIRNAVLHQVIAGRHLAAKTIAAVGDGHLARCIRAWPESARAHATRPAQRIGNRALVAEIWQRDDNAIDANRAAAGTNPRNS